MSAYVFIRPYYLISLIFSCLLLTAQPAYPQSGNMLYGVASGGAESFGVIFHIDPVTDTQIVDYTFPQTTTGSFNIGELIQADNGKYYGVSKYGGNGNKGAIFEWDQPTSNYTVMAHFNGANGSYPSGRLVQFNGKFYGYTSQGGQQDMGVIYEWDPVTDILEAKVHCTQDQGRWFEDYLTEYNGILYGTTCWGGTYDKGVLFSYDPGVNVYTKLFEFNGSNGLIPNSTLIVYEGKLLGTNRKNFGKIFEFDPSTNEYSIRASFDHYNGASPVGALTLLNNVFYGVTSSGGSANLGVIYQWDPATDSITKKADFHNYPDGFNPNGFLTVHNGILYGTTKDGGNNSQGTIFSFNPATETYSELRSFNASTGSFPLGGLLSSNGILFGTAAAGGYYDTGVIYEFDPVTNAYSVKVFTNSALLGKGPLGSLASYNGRLYGMTSKGGTYNWGTIFEWDPVTSTFTKRRDFSTETPGSKPMGTLTLHNNKFYGLTAEGGTYGKGVLFEWNPATNVYLKLKDFDGNNGSAPTATALTVYDNKLYGATTRGGAFDKGGIFEYDPLTDSLTNKVFFQTNGSYGMEGSLTLKDSLFYGMMYDGIFSWNPQTNQYSLLYQFTGQNGSMPTSSLTLVGDLFYANTMYGGAHNTGVLFSWNPDENLYLKYRNYDTLCTPHRGSLPKGSMIQYGDNLYGMTMMCGNVGDGTIYKFNVSTGAYQVIHHFNGDNGRIPEYTHLTIHNSTVNTTSIPESSIRVYPNPVGDFLHISIPYQQPGKTEVIIYNTLSQEVFRKQMETATELTIRCSHLQPGLYILKLISGKGISETAKFIKR